MSRPDKIMDNDTTADWKAHNATRAAKRHRNGESSTQILANAGIKFESKNNGWHIVISEPRVDFWPTTGLWITSKVKGRGVHALIKFIKAHKEK